MKRRRSIRTALILGNVVVLTALLEAFGAGLVFTNRAQTLGGLDHELADRAHHMAQMGAEHDGPPPPDTWPFGPLLGGPNGGGPNSNGPNGRGGPWGGGPNDNGPRIRQFRDLFRDAQRAADIRRPRFVGPTGNKGNSFRDVAIDERAAKLAFAGHDGFTEIDHDGVPVRVYTVPVRRSGHIVGALQVGHEIGEVQEMLAQQVKLLLIMLPFAAAGGAGGAVWLANRMLRPVTAVTRAAAGIGETDLSRRLEVQGDDEMAQLSRTFNGMLGRLGSAFAERNDAYTRLEKAYQNARRFTADASHELRTPLARLRLTTSAALDNAETSEELRIALKKVDHQTVGMASLVDQLLTLSRADAGQLPMHRERLDLRVVVADAIDTYSEEDPRILGTFPDGQVLVMADESHLKRVITNLVENARRHTAPDGRIAVTVKQVDGQAVIEVTDNGEGIGPEHLPQIFDRFYRVDASRRRKDGGSGLGLAIVRDLVEAHGGKVTAESALGKGTTFRVSLPALA